jgi:septal ring factor EnvC (AmiA/AmiB activator)
MTAFGATGRRSRVQALVRASAALVLAVSLTGCGPTDTGLQRAAAGQLQQRVLSVTQAAAVNDHAAALQALDGLEADLASAASNGQVSEERRRTIMTTIAAVRADLTAAAEAADAAAAKAAQEAAAAAAAAEAEKAKAEESSEAAQDDAPVPAPAQGPAQEQGKGSDGKAKGKKD